MNTYSHALIGDLIYKYLKNNCDIHLDFEEFIMGNIIPDIRNTCVIRPHFIRFSLKYIQREIELFSHKLLRSREIPKAHSLKLGVICHYYTDFFCYSHNGGYKQRIKNHKKYEADLNNYFTSRVDTIGLIDLIPDRDIKNSAGEINERTARLHREYITAPPSYENDIYYSLLACAGAVASLVRCCASNTVPAERFSVFMARAALAAEGK
ncbi:MAG: zinc dependent phospholipase C family protein [Clostridiales bacterium]|jgi:hypothetical protein|nr:zinc dependent phospholipase C family protein [Clostridiales bacterium]